MSQLTTLSRPYARAAFEAANAAGALPQWSQMLQVLSAVVSDADVARYLAGPSASAERKAQTLLELCGDVLNEQGSNFVKVVAENKRLQLLPEIARLFEEMKAGQERTLDVDVVSAYALTDSAEAKLAEALRKRLQREVKIKVQVDNSLIGGLVIRAGDVVIDGSVRGKLQKLAEALNS